MEIQSNFAILSLNTSANGKENGYRHFRLTCDGVYHFDNRHHNSRNIKGGQLCFIL